MGGAAKFVIGHCRRGSVMGPTQGMGERKQSMRGMGAIGRMLGYAGEAGTGIRIFVGCEGYCIRLGCGVGNADVGNAWFLI